MAASLLVIEQVANPISDISKRVKPLVARLISTIEYGTGGYAISSDEIVGHARDIITNRPKSHLQASLRTCAIVGTLMAVIRMLTVT